ncbi:MAG: BTAD domain-containing putative transcriptional regulator, partial [Chloroflexota bacterium]
SADYWLDTKALEKLSEDASADELITVLSEYRGELLPGFYDEWVVLEREHLNSIYEKKMARLMSLLEDEKRWSEILDWGERWIKLGQKPEPAYRALMSAHAAKGEMSKVAATYERCAAALKEIGFEPSEQTRGLYENLKAGKMPLEAESASPSGMKRKESARTNLPVPITSFIGREKEVAEVVQLLDRNRLVTLTGPGGVGKTRLAIQSSKSLLERFKHGVWWVELAPLSDGALAPQAAAQALDVRETPGQPLAESLKNFLRGKQLLLVFDNCEHLVEDCARLADDLLTHCANLKILTTSREGLGITGEMTYEVPSLSLPALERLTLIDLLMEYEGIRFFVERARAVKPDFALTEQNAAAAVQICARLDGIPLALELAAARTRMLSVEHIAERLNDRFNLLTQGSRAALPRHQTLRAAIDWSYDLLHEEARVLFRRLSVFAGGFTLEAAEEVCSDPPLDPRAVLNLLTRLVDRSLVKVTREGSVERYFMLETIREYAHEKFLKSSEASQVKNLHLDFYMKLAEEIEPKLEGAEQALWLEQLEIEQGNLRAALDWSLTGGELEAGMRLAGAFLS